METVNQVETTETVEEERTFTQDEVNRIVGERLSRESAKYADYDTLKAKAAQLDQIEEASKTELQKAQEKAANLQKELDGMKKADTIRTIRERVSTATGVPVSLITAETEEAAMEQATAIKQFADPGHPQVRDGGEVNPTHKMSTRDQFGEWFNDNF